MRSRRFGLAAALVALTAASTGCGDDTAALADGAATLRWHVGPLGCADAGASEIRVRLAGERTDTAGADPWRFACTEGSGTIEQLRPGRYDFVIEAIGASGRAEWVGRAERVEVRPTGTTQVPLVRLDAKPAELTVEWNFGSPLCRQIGVSGVELFAFDAHGTEEATARASCDVARETLVVRPGLYTVVVHGLTGEGEVTYATDLEVELARGEQQTATAVLERLD